MLKNIYFILFIFSLVSCNDTLNRVYDPGTFESDIQEIRQNGKLSDDDLQLLTKYIIFARLQGTDLEGKSYDEILDKVIVAKKTFINESLTRKDQQLMKRERLKPLLEVELLEKKFVKINNYDRMVYIVSFKNLSSKSIRTIVGDISILDLIGKEIVNVDIMLNEKLRAMTTITKSFNVEYNPVNEKDKSIRSKDLINVQVEWNPGKIIYDDGQLVD